MLYLCCFPSEAIVPLFFCFWHPCWFIIEWHVTKCWISLILLIYWNFDTVYAFMETEVVKRQTERGQQGLEEYFISWPNFSIAMELVAFRFLEVPSAQNDKYNFSMTKSKPGRQGSSTDVEATNLQSCSPLCGHSPPFLSWHLTLRLPIQLQSGFVSELSLLAIACMAWAGTMHCL